MEPISHSGKFYEIIKGQCSLKIDRPEGNFRKGGHAGPHWSGGI